MGILRTDKISGLETPTAVTGSVSFDGNGDQIDVPDSGDTFDFLNADFTIEAWVYPVEAKDQAIFGKNKASSYQGYEFDVFTNGRLRFYSGNGSAYNSAALGAESSAGDVPLNKWTHVAVTRSGSTLRLFANGLVVGSNTSFTHTISGSTEDAEIGSDGASGGTNYHFNGYISNLRVLKGTALYTADFTVPTHELEVIKDTVLLACNNPDSVTAASYAGIGTSVTLTATGNVSVASTVPGLTRDFTSGTQFEGVSRFDTQGYFVPPSGTTEQRGRGRGLNAGGGSPYSNTIEYIQIQTLGNAQDFGDLTLARAFVSAVSSPTRAVFTNGYNNSPGTGSYNTIDYVTIATTGNAVDFGAETASSHQSRGACSNNTRGVIAAGSATNVVEYITIATLGTIDTFGEYGIDRYRDIGGCSSSTRGLFAGGFNPANTNSIEYITIATTGNTQSFGDLTTARFGPGAASSPTRGVFMGGDTFPALSGSVTIDYVTIASLGNAQDFGDLLFSSYRVAATSNGNRAVAFRSSPSPAGVNSINYITISSTGNAQDFGDRFYNIAELADSATSDSHGGLS